MNNFDFTFQDSYSGFWNIEGIGNHIAGTLFLYENSIELDLFYEGTIDLTNRKIKFVQGRAFSKNDFGKEKEFWYIYKPLTSKMEWFITRRPVLFKKSNPHNTKLYSFSLPKS